MSDLPHRPEDEDYAKDYGGQVVTLKPKRDPILDPLTEPHDIGWAIHQIWLGRHVCRTGWNGRGMYLYLTIPRKADHQPYIIMKTAQHQFVPWLCSQTDLLATDWEIAKVLQ